MNLEEATKLARQQMKEKLRGDLEDKKVSNRELIMLANELGALEMVDELFKERIKKREE